MVGGTTTCRTSGCTKSPPYCASIRPEIVMGILDHSMAIIGTLCLKFLDHSMFKAGTLRVKYFISDNTIFVLASTINLKSKFLNRLFSIFLRAEYDSMVLLARATSSDVTCITAHAVIIVRLHVRPAESRDFLFFEPLDHLALER